MRPERQHGFSIVSAIFLIVVLAALGGFIATVATTQHIGSALDVSGARAYQTARAGTEWGLFKARGGGCAGSTNIGTIDTMTVTVACSIVVTGAPAPGEVGLGTIYAITATACNMPTVAACPGATDNPNYVERSLSVTAEF
jgi:MSHA biogenesis protein MshP